MATSALSLEHIDAFYGDSHVLADEGKHGFELIHKPYTVEALSATLRRALAGRPRP